MIERRALRFEPEILSDLELPCLVARGAADGPHLALLAGIHGCEYSSIAAVVRFMAALDTRSLRGCITALPIVNMTSFSARSPFVVPEDGKNLNRCFPGAYGGTFSDVLARAIFDQVVEPSDVLLDLHGGDLVEALEPFTLYDASPVENRARELAVAFGLPYVVRSTPEEAPIAGTTSSAAASAAIPAVIAEAGGRGLLEDTAVQLHLNGLANVLCHLEMLPGEPAPVQGGMRHVNRFVWIRSQAGGWWEAAVRSGDEVQALSRVGVVLDLYGDIVEEVIVPEDGVVLFLTTSPAIGPNGLLLGLGVGLEPIVSG